MTVDNIIEGLSIMRKYAGGDPFFVQAEHDEIYALSTEVQLSDEDVKRLEELGWLEDSDMGCWKAFT